MRDKSLKFHKADHRNVQSARDIGKALGWDECKVQFVIWAHGTSLDVNGIYDGDPTYRPAICAWEAWKAAWKLRKSA